MARAWFLVVIAIILEVCGTVSMKLSDGFTQLLPSIMLFVFYAVSLSLLAMSLKKLPLSITYAIWAGVGTSLTAGIGFFYFKEEITLPILIGIGLTIVGVILIKLGDDSSNTVLEKGHSK
jgi:small multidrug resistance pump